MADSHEIVFFIVMFSLFIIASLPPIIGYKIGNKKLIYIIAIIEFIFGLVVFAAFNTTTVEIGAISGLIAALQLYKEREKKESSSNA